MLKQSGLKLFFSLLSIGYSRPAVFPPRPAISGGAGRGVGGWVPTPAGALLTFLAGYFPARMLAGERTGYPNAGAKRTQIKTRGRRAPNPPYLQRAYSTDGNREKKSRRWCTRQRLHYFFLDSDLSTERSEGAINALLA